MLAILCFIADTPHTPLPAVVTPPAIAAFAAPIVTPYVYSFRYASFCHIATSFRHYDTVTMLRPSDILRHWRYTPHNITRLITP